MDPAATIQADSSSYFDENSTTFVTYRDTCMRILEFENLNYHDRVLDMLKNGKRRLIINLQELAAYDRDVFLQIQKIPIQFIAPWQSALRQFIRDNFEQDPSLNVDPRGKYSVGFTGLELDKNLTPRDLKSTNVGRLLCVEGIATRCSLVRAKVGQSVHYCDVTDRYSTAFYHDNTSLTGAPTTTVYPTKDENGNALTTEYGLSYFYNTQSLGLQEMPENTPQGLLPCSINVIMNEDLVDSCKPGDRIRITGVYRALPSYIGGHENLGLFGSILIALNIEKIEHKLKSTSIDQKDLKKIITFAKRNDCLKILSQSIAPSIYGHTHIKRALLLLLLGGTEKNLDTGTHIRGDINVLMVGDPSTAKSQLLRFVLHLAPLAINTTGRGSSGVGLTAAIVSDRDTGEKRLEAGAMVLADRGVVCIDEFDKMSEADRVAIHEVMEQQTVTISKAGVHMSLNSRCSVVAAANPIYGQYDINIKPHVNVGLPDSLLSRFDLLFIVLDRPIAELDRHIAGRVLDNHTSRAVRARNTDDEHPLDPADSTTIQVAETQVYVSDSNNNASSFMAMGDNDDDDQNMNNGKYRINSPNDLVTIEFLRKYIAYAKGLSPVLSDQACEYIAQRYTDIRQRAKINRDDSSLPITARLLETLIRLSTAVAKSRLGGFVTRHDAKIAYRLLSYALNAAEQIGRGKSVEDLPDFQDFGDEFPDRPNGGDDNDPGPNGGPGGRGGNDDDDDDDDDDFILPGDPSDDDDNFEDDNDPLNDAMARSIRRRRNNPRGGTTGSSGKKTKDTNIKKDNKTPKKSTTKTKKVKRDSIINDDEDDELDLADQLDGLTMDDQSDDYDSDNDYESGESGEDDNDDKPLRRKKTTRTKKSTTPRVKKETTPKKEITTPKKSTTTTTTNKRNIIIDEEDMNDGEDLSTPVQRRTRTAAKASMTDDTTTKTTTKKATTTKTTRKIKKGQDDDNDDDDQLFSDDDDNDDNNDDDTYVQSDDDDEHIPNEHGWKDEYEEDIALRDIKTRSQSKDDKQIVSLTSSQISTFRRCFLACSFDPGTQLSLELFTAKINQHATLKAKFSMDEIKMIIESLSSEENGDTAPVMLTETGNVTIV